METDEIVGGRTGWLEEVDFKGTRGRNALKGESPSRLQTRNLGNEQMFMAIFMGMPFGLKVAFRSALPRDFVMILT